MKIYNDATSPFGRKVVVAAMERQLPATEVFLDLNNAEFLDLWNPLRQIPTLVLDSGRAFYDSDVIVEALDRNHKGPPLIPEGEALQVLTRMSLANGLMEATMSRMMEMRRVEGKSDALIAKFEARIWRVLAVLDGILPEIAVKPGSGLRADQIAAAVALGYADFRFAENWRDRFPKLGAWYAPIAELKSMRLTAPTRTAAVPPEEMTR